MGFKLALPSSSSFLWVVLVVVLCFSSGGPSSSYAAPRLRGSVNNGIQRSGGNFLVKTDMKVKFSFLS